MRSHIDEIENGEDNTDVLKHFIFKVNGKKFKDNNLLTSQIKKVVQRIKSKHNVLDKDYTVKFFYDGDDFVKHKRTLLLSFYIKKC